MNKGKSDELIIAYKELVFQDEEREKRAAELFIANKELAFQNDEKEKRAAELIIANKELVFQNGEKEKRAAELIIANKELAFQNDEKEKRAAELIIANKELAFQNKEKEKRTADLVILSNALKTQKEELRSANIRLLHLNQHLEQRVFERTGELEKLNHELKDLNLSKDKFVAVISHDLRNPLAVLLLASDELSSESENHVFDPIQPIVKMIHRSAHNILQQLNELVHWAKTQQEKTTLNLEKINLGAAVNQSFELLSANTTQKNIILENNVPSDLFVNADALMLRSILQNLVTNSIKYSLPGGLVVVTAQTINMMAEVCIIDSGTGMDANTRENLFTKSN